MTGIGGTYEVWSDGGILISGTGELEDGHSNDVVTDFFAGDSMLDCKIVFKPIVGSSSETSLESNKNKEIQQWLNCIKHLL